MCLTRAGHTLTRCWLGCTSWRQTMRAAPRRGLGLDAVDRRESLRRTLARLPARERRVIGLRFVGELTQSQIAERIGVSQMQVCRLLTRPMTRLRDAMQAEHCHRDTRRRPGGTRPRSRCGFFGWSLKHWSGGRYVGPRFIESFPGVGG